MRKFPSLFSIAKDPEWIEKLDEFFEETAVHYQNFQNEPEFLNSAQNFELGLIEPGCVHGPEKYPPIKFLKLGPGDPSGIRFEGRLDKKSGIPEILKQLLKHFPEAEKELSVLITDDDREFTTLIQEQWEAKSKPSTIVRTAENGLEALEELKNYNPDVLVMDLKMPGMGGSNLYRQFRQKDKSTPVIILSAVTGSEELKVLKRTGNPVCIEKSTLESLPDPLWWRALKLKVFGSRDLRR